jgi:hypothetical protein
MPALSGRTSTRRTSCAGRTTTSTGPPMLKIPYAATSLS